MFISFDQPEFVDNRSGNTLAAAIITYLQGLDSKLAADTTLEFVTGYFAIDDGLERVEHFLDHARKSLTDVVSTSVTSSRERSGRTPTTAS